MDEQDRLVVVKVIALVRRAQEARSDAEDSPILADQRGLRLFRAQAEVALYVLHAMVEASATADAFIAFMERGGGEPPEGRVA